MDERRWPKGSFQSQMPIEVGMVEGLVAERGGEKARWAASRRESNGVECHKGEIIESKRRRAVRG